MHLTMFYPNLIKLSECLKMGADCLFFSNVAYVWGFRCFVLNRWSENAYGLYGFVGHKV